MSIRATCPSCKASLTVDDEKAGKKIRCRKCEEVVTVPAAGAKKKREEESAIQSKAKVRVKARSRDDDEDDDDDDEDDRPSKRKKAKSGPPMLLVSLLGGGGLLLMLLGGGVIGWTVMKKPSGNDRIAQAALPPQAVVNTEPDPKQPPVVAPKTPKKDQPRKVDPFAGKPLPDSMGADTVQRVKAATIFVRVTMADNGKATGSGFMAIEPGLVVTNAHVVDMLQRNARPPKEIQAIIHSGQPNEVKLKAKLLGVDRFADLAFLRIEGPNLPEALFIDAERKLFESQKLNVFGFPLGEQLGLEISVGSSTVSSFRKHLVTREVDKIQVEGGMQPGNSGGPVVNSLGNVVGVAVSGLPGTNINFAIPAQKVLQAMDGRVSETRIGQAFTDNGQLKLPVKLVCVDPLQKISQLKVDVWTGAPGPTRVPSLQPPQAQAGDGARQTHTLTYQGGIGTVDVPLPPAGPGQVYWAQPVITNSAGTHWGPAVAAPLELYPVERKPANLTVNVTNEKLRTVKFKTSHGILATKNDKQAIIQAHKLDLELLEELVPTSPPSADKTRIRTAYGAIKIGIDSLGKANPATKTEIDVFRSFPLGYTVDKSNRLVERSRISKMNAQVPLTTRLNVLAMQEQVYNSLEAVTMPMPNRTVQPMESWDTKMPYMEPAVPSPDMKITKAPEVIDLVVKCTFQGVRTRNSRTEAIVTMTGSGQRRGKNAGLTGAEITGRIAFDLTGGFISFSQVKIHSDLYTLADGSELSDSLDIDLDRQPGNPLGLSMPKDLPPPVVAKGKVVFISPGMLGVPGNLSIPSVNPGLQGNVPAIAQQIKLQAGKTYVITLDSNQFDAYLILKDASGKVVAEDDDGASTPTNPSLNARIEFRCTQTGVYQVILTTHDGKRGQFQFKVQEAQ